MDNPAPEPSQKTEPDPERQARARVYARMLLRLGSAELALDIAVLAALIPGGFSVFLRDLLALPQPARVPLYALSLALGYAAVSLPLNVYGGLVLPRRFGLSTQSLRAWLWDRAKGLLVGLTLGVAALSVLYWLLASYPATWWLWASALSIVFTVLLTNLAPVLLVPLFFKQKPLADDELRRRLLAMAEQAKVKVRGVFVLDMSSKGTAANAALMGLGNTRRIVLGDTLLGAYPQEEIESVLAHEIGHHAHRDIPLAIVLQSGASIAGFYLASLALPWAVPRFGYQGLADVAALPVLVAVVAGLSMATGPVMSAYSRWRERAADLYSLRLTGNPAAFVSAMTRLTDQNLSEAHPSRWVEVLFYDHPPYYKRVALARQYAGAAPGRAAS